MHVHTYCSKDSNLEPRKIIQLMKEKGLDGFCIMDHNHFFQDPSTEELARSYGLVLFNGMEYSSANGHILIYGLSKDQLQCLKEFEPAQRIIDFALKNDGVAVPAHPFLDWKLLKNRTDGIKNPAGEEDKLMLDHLYTLSGLEAIETINGALIRLIPYSNQRALNAQKKLSLGGIGGSDAHLVCEIGSTYTVFPDRINTVKELVQAVKSKNYKAVDGICFT